MTEVYTTSKLTATVRITAMRDFRSAAAFVDAIVIGSLAGSEEVKVTSIIVKEFRTTEFVNEFVPMDSVNEALATFTKELPNVRRK